MTIEQRKSARTTSQTRMFHGFRRLCNPKIGVLEQVAVHAVSHTLTGITEVSHTLEMIKSPQPLNRRRVLIGLGVTAVAAALSGCGSDTSSPLAQYLYATETKTAGNPSTFVSEGDFTSEVLQQVRNSTYLVIFTYTDGSRSMGTGWIAEKKTSDLDNTEDLYVATAAHGLSANGNQDPVNITRVQLCRPHIDAVLYDADMTAFAYAISPDYSPNSVPGDYALVKLHGIPDSKKLQALPFAANYASSIDESIMVGGFPFEYIRENDPSSSVMDAFVTTITSVDQLRNTITFFGVGDEGMSGSAILASINGKPTVVAILSKGDTTIRPKTAQILAATFDFAPLMKQLTGNKKN